MAVFKPHAYQKTAIDFIHEHPGAGLFLDMGMGKTVASLTAANDLMYDKFEIRKTLVIAPKRVAKDVWPAEVEKWEHLNHLSVVDLTGPKAERTDNLKQKGDLYVTTRDLVPWLVDTVERQWPFDMVIVDELSSFKNNQSKRFKALRKVRPLIKRIVGLTGTPAPNGYEDLWSQIFLLDGGERLGRTITAYRRKYFSEYFTGTFYVRSTTETARKEIDQKLSDICISMKSEDYLKLKEPQMIQRYVTLSDETMAVYNDMVRHSLVELEDTEVAAVNSGVVVNKLLQIANGGIYDEDKQYNHIHDEKLDALSEMLEDINENVLVFYTFRSDKERLLERFPKARAMETSQDVKDWNAKKVKMMIAHPASCGHGLNLQDGGSVVIWFGLTYNLEYYLQANKRLHRQGQESHVRIYHLLAKDTIDIAVMKSLEAKKVEQEGLIESLKERMEQWN